MHVESMPELNRLVASGKTVKYLFFWGRTAQRDGGVDVSCLSQWWPAKFTLDGQAFASAEQYMMWRKARLFGDEPAAERIGTTAHPRRIKELGRQVRGFDEDVWRAHRFEIVVDGNRAKFSSDARLRDFLAGTRKRVLVEASPVDRVWGNGFDRDHPFAAQPAKWRGLNLLGFALMRVRRELG